MFPPLQIVLTPGMAGLTSSDARLTHAPAFSPFSNHVTRFFYSHHSNFVTRLLIYSQLESRYSAFDILVTRCQCVFTHNLQPTTSFIVVPSAVVPSILASSIDSLASVVLSFVSVCKPQSSNVALSAVSLASV